MNNRVVRAPGQLHDEIEGSVVLLGRKSGNYLGLNEVGSAIWRALERDVRVGDLCEMVATSFGVTPESLQQDVTTFLGQLLDQDLIIVAPEEAPGGSRASTLA